MKNFFGKIKESFKKATTPKDGKGKVKFDDGATYDGEWKNHEIHGHGTYIWKDGRTYTGQWVNGKQHGKGTDTFPDGTIYEGEWKNGKKHGKGKMIFSKNEIDNGSILISEYENDAPVGKCKFHLIAIIINLFCGNKV